MRQLGPKRVNRLGMRINVDGMLTPEELRAGTADRAVAVITLLD